MDRRAGGAAAGRGSSFPGTGARTADAGDAQRYPQAVEPAGEPGRLDQPAERGAGGLVDPLGDGLTSVLPEGLAGAFGLPIAPGLDWPVVAPGAEVIPPLGDGLPEAPPDTPPVPAAPPEAPPAPAACAIANELESASAPANAIVANFMGRSLAVEPGQLARRDRCSLTS